MSAIMDVKAGKGNLQFLLSMSSKEAVLKQLKIRQLKMTSPAAHSTAVKWMLGDIPSCEYHKTLHAQKGL